MWVRKLSKYGGSEPLDLDMSTPTVATMTGGTHHFPAPTTSFSFPTSFSAISTPSETFYISKDRKQRSSLRALSVSVSVSLSVSLSLSLYLSLSLSFSWRSSSSHFFFCYHSLHLQVRLQPSIPSLSFFLS